MKAPGKFTGILTEADIHDERELVRTKWESPAQIRSWLLQHGFNRLGGGVFSSAYAKPRSRRVVKISLRSDECWLNFARWAIGLTSNPYVPKISFIKQYEGTRKSSRTKRKVKTKFFVTITERLQPADDGEYMLPRVINRLDDPVVLATLVHEAGSLLEPLDLIHLKERLAELGYKTEKSQTELLKKKKGHKFIKTLKQIDKIQGAKCWHDLHSGNTMYRPSTNTLVITDPLAQDWSN